MRVDHVGNYSLLLLFYSYPDSSQNMALRLYCHSEIRIKYEHQFFILLLEIYDINDNQFRKKEKKLNFI